MAAISNAELLTAIKKGMGNLPDFHDDAIQIYIEDVKFFMSDAGVHETVVNDTAAVGCILRGVIDLWNFGSGDGKFSEYFKQRVIQLAAKPEIKANGGVENDSTE